MKRKALNSPRIPMFYRLRRKLLLFLTLLLALCLAASAALADSDAVLSQASESLLATDESNQQHAVTAMGKLLSLLSKPGLTVSQTMDGLTRLDFVCTADESTDSLNQKLRYRWNDRISVLLSFRENETRLKAVTVAVLGKAWTDSQGSLRSSNEDMLGYVMDTMDQLSRTGTPNKVPETNASWACSWQFNDMVAAIPTWDDDSPYLDGLLSIDFLYNRNRE